MKFQKHWSAFIFTVKYSNPQNGSSIVVRIFVSGHGAEMFYHRLHKHRLSTAMGEM